MEASVSSGENTCASEWTQSIAVGSKDFVESTKLRLGIQAQERKVSETKSLLGGHPLKGLSREKTPLLLKTPVWHFCG